MSTKQASADFSTRLTEAIESSVLALIRKGDWLSFDYAARVKVDFQFLREIYAGLDFARVRRLVSERVEERIADSILNGLATELANDTKQILSQRELREDVRAIIREKIREASGAISKAEARHA